MKTPSTSVLACACATLTALALSPVIVNGWVSDDHHLILSNPHVTGFDVAYLLTHHLWDVPFAPVTSTHYYRPIPAIANAAIYWMAGDDPLPFHVLDLVLHALSTALALTWVARRIDETGSRAGRIAAAAATLIFALHPARAQSVAWISGSTDLWATLLVLIGLNVAARRRDLRHASVAGVFFAMAMLAKEVAVVAPFLWILDRYAFASRPTRREIVALLVPTAATLALRTSVVGVPGRPPGHGGLVETAGRALFSLGAYLRDAILPIDPLLQLNEAWPTLWAEEPGVGITVAIGAGGAFVFVALGALCYRDRRLRALSADVAWFVVPLVPALNIIPLGDGAIVAGRVLYLPLLGATALCARWLLHVARARPRARTVAATAAFAVAVLMAWGSSKEVDYYASDLTLSRHWLSQRPDDPAVADNLARVLLREGALTEAYDVLGARLDRSPEAKGGVYAQVTWSYVRLVLTSDVETDQLLALRHFYDAIASGRPAVLDLPERSLSPVVSAAARDEIMTNPTYGDFYDAWGHVHARTLDVQGALRIFEDAPAVTSERLSGRRRRIRAIAWNADWHGALRAVSRAEQTFPDASWSELRAALRAGEALWSEPPADPIESAVAKSRLMSSLGLPALGRALLADFEGAADVRLVHARVQADISDQRPDLALSELARALERFPAARDELEMARASVQRFAREHPSVRVPPPWER